MRRLLLLLLVWSGLTNIVSAIEIDECKTDIYFANGILTTKKQAKYNAEEILQPAIIEKLGIGNFSRRIGNVAYAYNQTTDSQWWDSVETFFFSLPRFRGSV